MFTNLLANVLAPYVAWGIGDDTVISLPFSMLATLLAAFLERPFTTAAGFQQHALLYSVRANILSFQQAVVQPEAAVDKVQQLHSVAPAVEEQEQTAVSRIGLELAADDSRQAGESLSHVGRPGVSVNLQLAAGVHQSWANAKENFRIFWTYHNTYGARQFFKRWYAWAARCQLAPITKVAKLIHRHLENLLTYCRHKITNAVSEGLNSQIQSNESAARGFRQFANYRIRILFYCGKLDLAP